jgi:hypothetical protein
MKTFFSRFQGNLLLIISLATCSGCVTHVSGTSGINHEGFYHPITERTVQKAVGYTDEQEPQPSNGDKLITYRGVYFVVHPPKGTDVSHLSLPENMPSTPVSYYAFKPKPALYTLLPLTVAADVALLPIEAVGGGLGTLFFYTLMPRNFCLNRSTPDNKFCKAQERCCQLKPDPVELRASRFCDFKDGSGQSSRSD